MYNEVKSSFRKHIDFIILDIVCMVFSFVISYYIRHNNLALFDESTHITALVILIFANLITCYIFNSMQDVLKRSRQLEFYATIKQVLLVEIILILFLFVSKTSENFSRNVIIIFPFLYLIFSYFVRLFYKRIVLNNFKNSKTRKLIIITTSDKEKELVERFDKKVNDYSISKMYFVDVTDSFEILKEIQKEYVDEILLSIDDVSKVKNIIDSILATGIVLHVETGLINQLSDGSGKMFIERVADSAVVTCTINTISFVQLIVKRIIDIIFGIFGTIATIIFTIILGPIIIIKSPGPIFFVQKRVGKNGKLFNMYKFRSMRTDAESLKDNLRKSNDIKDGMMFKIDNDPRIIPGIGNFIRKTSIDEFPQFINVLKGDMSVVGTRPPTVDEWDKYELHHRARLAIKPGITGLWQVSGRSDIKNFEEVVKLDTKYINTFSLWQDASIILRTIAVVLGKQGAK